MILVSFRWAGFRNSHSETSATTVFQGHASAETKFDSVVGEIECTSFERGYALQSRFDKSSQNMHRSRF